MASYKTEQNETKQNKMIFKATKYSAGKSLAVKPADLNSIPDTHVAGLTPTIYHFIYRVLLHTHILTGKK